MLSSDHDENVIPEEDEEDEEDEVSFNANSSLAMSPQQEEPLPNSLSPEPQQESMKNPRQRDDGGTQRDSKGTAPPEHKDTEQRDSMGQPSERSRNDGSRHIKPAAPAPPSSSAQASDVRDRPVAGRDWIDSLP